MIMDLQLLNDVNIFEAGNWTPSALPANFDESTLFQLGSPAYSASTCSHVTCSLCDSFDVSVETLKEMERVMQFLKALHTKRQRRSFLSIPSDINMQFSDSDAKVQLVSGFHVYIKKADLEIIKLKWKANANGLIRQLMKAIVGPSKLKNMTPMGRGRNAIPQSVMKAIFKYVTVRRKLEITYPEYTRVLSQMCYRLRADHLKKQEMVNLSEPGNEIVRPIPLPSTEKRKQTEKSSPASIVQNEEMETVPNFRKEQEQIEDSSQTLRRSSRDKNKDSKLMSWKTELMWDDEDFDDDDWHLSDSGDDDYDEHWKIGGQKKPKNKTAKGGRTRKK